MDGDRLVSLGGEVSERASAKKTGPATNAVAGGRRLPGLFYLMVVLCFLLPFVTVSCRQEATFTGVHLVTGTGGEELRKEASTKDQVVTQFLAALALGLAISGVIFSSIRKGSRLARLALVGMAGLGTLLALNIQIFSAYWDFEGYVNVEMRFGYRLAAILFVAGAGAALVPLLRKRNVPQGSSGGLVVPNRAATVSMWCGLIGVALVVPLLFIPLPLLLFFFAPVPLVGVLLLTALTAGGIGLKNARRDGTPSNRATVGLVLGSLLIVVVTLGGVAIVSST